MISTEDKKKAFRVALEVSGLYVNTQASTREISDACDIPVATVKRYITTPEKRRDEILKTLQGEVTEHDLDYLIDEIKESKRARQKETKYKTELAVIGDAEAKRIHEMYEDATHIVRDETKALVTNLRVSGKSFRKIGEELQLSPAHAYKIVSEMQVEETKENSPSKK